MKNSESTLDSSLASLREFQVRGKCARERNPITGISTTSDSMRRSRPKADLIGEKLHTPISLCDVCLGRTIPAVMISNGKSLIVPDVTTAIEHGRRWIVENGPVSRENFGKLLDVFRKDWSSSPIVAKTFPNVCPLPGVGSLDILEGFVTAAHPDHHDLDISECPLSVLCTFIDTWEAFYVWCRTKGNILVPYINGGRDRRSGQSLAHPHSQHLVLSGMPPLYQAMQDAKDDGECRVCQLQKMRNLQIAVPGSEALLLMAHPAPEQSWTLLILSAKCDDGFSGVDSMEFSTIFATALRALARSLGGIPPYNLVVRVGTGHFHAEIVPRNTNVKAGAEIGLLEFFVDVAPSEVQAVLSSVISDGVSL